MTSSPIGPFFWLDASILAGQILGWLSRLMDVPVSSCTQGYAEAFRIMLPYRILSPVQHPCLEGAQSRIWSHYLTIMDVIGHPFAKELFPVFWVTVLMQLNWYSIEEQIAVVYINLMYFLKFGARRREVVTYTYAF